MLKVARDVLYGIDMRASTSQQRQDIDNSTFKCVLVSSTSSSSTRRYSISAVHLQATKRLITSEFGRCSS